MRLLIATSNPGKASEYRSALEPLGFEVTALADYPPLAEPEETESTFRGNARLEADYKQPVFYDERLLITVRAAKIGNTSLLLEYGAWSAEKGLTCQSTSLLVMVVTVTGKKERISDAMRASIADFEGREY